MRGGSGGGHGRQASGYWDLLLVLAGAVGSSHL